MKGTKCQPQRPIEKERKQFSEAYQFENKDFDDQEKGAENIK